MQKLPTGEYWTSLNSSLAPDDSTKPLKDLPTGYAELIAILPSMYNATSDIPTLGSFMPKKLSAAKNKLPQARRVSCGSFLDYGPYASFAPTFDSEGGEVGRSQLGEVLWGIEGRKRGKAKERAVEEADKTAESSDDMTGRGISTDEMENRDILTSLQPQRSQNVDIEQSLDGLLSLDQIRGIKSALGNLELEEAVQELLERNRKALERLEELQVARLASAGGGTTEVDVGSEEWDTG
jgi:hypothetical protein